MLLITNKRQLNGLLACFVLTVALSFTQDVLASDVQRSQVQPEQNKLFEGDILTSDNLAVRGSTGRSVGVQHGEYVWQDGIVPYFIDPALAEDVASNIQFAIDTWNALASVSIEAIDPTNKPLDYLHFVPADGCASWIGRQGGVQLVWVAPNCTSGSLMHEIGHALGLEHEHTRADRDQHIKINWSNIDSDKLKNFDISNLKNQAYGDYDYDSIMHYGEYFFSANGGRTIEPLHSDSKSLGQRVAPSVGDIQAIADIYGTDLSLVSSVDTVNGASEVSILVTNEHEQGANNLDVQLNIGAANYSVTAVMQDWDCSASLGMLSCRLKRLSGGEHSAIVVVLDQVFVSSELQLSLSTKTANASGYSAPLILAANAGGENPLLSDDSAQSRAGAFSQWLLLIMVTVMLGRRVRLNELRYLCKSL